VWIRANCFEERLQLDREGSVQVKGLLSLGMGEGEMGGVKEVAVELEVFREVWNDVGRAIEGVADDGLAEGLGMDANLMGAAGFDADFGEGEGTIRSSETFEDVEV
jgi:hypothetical protein